MRFFEYESRQIVERAGIPVTKYGFCTTAEEAREAAEEIGGPTVIKSQVLTGGRMKAGGVKFADTPEEAAAARRRHPQARDRRPHAARRPGGPQGRDRAGVLRGGRLGRDPQAADDALLRHGRASTSRRWPRNTPTTSAAATSPTSSPSPTTRRSRSSPRPALTGCELTRATPVLARLARLFRD